ncbi:MAG: tetratricopeptide repeat protein [Rhodospirillaceae bacterium]
MHSFRTPLPIAAALVAAFAIATPAHADEAENIFWQSISASQDSAEYCAYLAAYPDGKYATLARLRVKKFGAACESDAKAAAPAPEPQSTLLGAARPGSATMPRVVDSFFASPYYYDGKKAFDAGDFGNAMRIWMDAAQRGHGEAAGLIGGLYHAGMGVERDFDKAFEWYSKAAEKDVAQAQVGLGSMYGDGHGVERDYVKARMWFAIAADRGNERAEYNMKKVAQRMSEAEIKEADALALEWIKTHHVRH